MTIFPLLGLHWFLFLNFKFSQVEIDVKQHQLHKQETLTQIIDFNSCFYFLFSVDVLKAGSHLSLKQNVMIFFISFSTKSCISFYQ